ncbi:MAG: Alpha-ketoglutarate-dependent dioxygenase alkB 2 [Piccolia ochrophora]|nr:MAG: Alpha-ketoglutarate-dependent dioxygenase alkB 2 [Piccolia ochrophora]
MPAKRTLDSFFLPAAKVRKVTPPPSDEPSNPPKEAPTHDPLPSTHPTYPFPVPPLPSPLHRTLTTAVPAHAGVPLPKHPDLDVLSYTPYVPRPAANDLFRFLRDELFFYRVEYSIKRGLVDALIKTPRFTTVFGIDATSTFSSTGTILDARTNNPVPPTSRYKTCAPRPIPACLRTLLETIPHPQSQSQSHPIIQSPPPSPYNICLVNYYASARDSISPHSDNEHFLGPEPCIASFSLGGTRDFVLKRKPPPPVSSSSGATHPSDTPQKRTPKQPSLTIPLRSGDMLLMRGATQRSWLHAIPKRGPGGGGGEKRRRLGGGKGESLEHEARINITFRRALVPAGTENYYRYNVGGGAVWKWDGSGGEMRLWNGEGEREGMM